MKITIGYVTARRNPEPEWFLKSLRHQIKSGDEVEIIFVDFLRKIRGGLMVENGYFGRDVATGKYPAKIRHVSPKPTVFQGENRLTREDFWATSCYRNTIICLATHPFISFLDDRCVLMPTWLQSIREAMDGNYAVCGSYEKRHGMTVENGIIKHGGIVTGTDPRRGLNYRAIHCSGSWFFGCTTAMPLEWALSINGYDESCDSLGLEDCIFGEMLERNGYPIRFDERMKIIEDRTPSECEPVLCKRTDKGISPQDKSHGLLKRVAGKLKATHHWDLREIREKVLRGEPFPPATQPTHDWWDNQPLCEFP